MKNATQTATLSFADLLDPRLGERADADGALVDLDPCEAAAHDVVLDAEARISSAEGWAELAALARGGRFADLIAALADAREREARCRDGGLQ